MAGQSWLGQDTGRRSALIVASDDYQDPGLRELRAPSADAEELARVLRDPDIGGFDVRTMLNEPAHVISEAVEEFFADRSPDDLLLVHFSCHGIKDEEGELYFAASNTKLRLLGATAVPANFVNRRMNHSRSRRIVLLLDCCYAGAFERGMTARAGSGMDIKERFGGRGRAVITASGAMEYAFEGDQLADGRAASPSVFTSAMVNGLATGEADRDQDGFVALDELYDYVYDAVREVTPNQTPGKWTFGVQGDLYIARRSGPVTTPAPLPSELQSSVDSPLAGVRTGVIHELGQLQSSQHAGLALAARQALERLAEDDSRMVAAAAVAALGSRTEPPTPEPAAADTATAGPSEPAEPAAAASVSVSASASASASASGSATDAAPAAEHEQPPAPAEPTAPAAKRRSWPGTPVQRIAVVALALVVAAGAIVVFLTVGGSGGDKPIPSAFAGTWTGSGQIPSEGVNVTWRVVFVAGASTAQLEGTATNCAGGLLTLTGGNDSVMKMRLDPPGQCSPGDVTFTLQGADTSLFEVDPDNDQNSPYNSTFRRE